MYEFEEEKGEVLESVDHKDLEVNLAEAEAYVKRFRDYEPQSDHPVAQFFHIQLLGKILHFSIPSLRLSNPVNLNQSSATFKAELLATALLFRDKTFELWNKKKPKYDIFETENPFA